MLVVKGGITRNIDESRLVTYKTKGYTVAEEKSEESTSKKKKKSEETNEGGEQ